MCVCVCVCVCVRACVCARGCVSIPQAIKSHSCEMKPVQPIEQVLSLFIRMILAIDNVALVTKPIYQGNVGLLDTHEYLST